MLVSEMDYCRKQHEQSLLQIQALLEELQIGKINKDELYLCRTKETARDIEHQSDQMGRLQNDLADDDQLAELRRAYSIKLKPNNDMSVDGLDCTAPLSIAHNTVSTITPESGTRALHAVIDKGNEIVRSSDELDLLERAHIFDLRTRQRQRRRQRELLNPFDKPDTELMGTYRLTKALAEELVNELLPLMAPRRSGDISIENKICDANLNIVSVDAGHGGDSRDSFIWNAHPLEQHLGDLYINENETLWMLADSGYPLRPWMMTPIHHAASGSREEYYTYLHIREFTVTIPKLKSSLLSGSFLSI
ncbi:hypothetical protein EVAR_22220_1 [Eumeta japonica]|uniref:DDE Tnp4 domain-containing protein n=1 Tax=Eumeta variegata TaxID=151549 RepID=A0A4C1UAF5_EUMVA|nr:hypothetical protein EVAR_22220_1 [Eumeta japonica]